MQAFATKVRHFLTSEDGPTAVEYAVMLALIIVACITVVTTLGSDRQQHVQHRQQRDEPVEHIGAVASPAS